MAKGGKGQRSNMKNPRKGALQYKDTSRADMDDEIDAFHKQRDVVPFDLDDDLGDSDEDNEHPVFPIEDASDDEDDDEDDTQQSGLAAKIERQRKSLWAKSGGVEDETHDGAEADEEKTVWGRSKNMYYNADNVDPELQSSDDDHLDAEEAEVLRLQNEKAKALSMEDFGLEYVNQDESDGDHTFEEIFAKGKSASKASNVKEAQDEIGTGYEVVVKDLNALSREEQMDIIYSSAPELVGLLSELNDALEQLESKVDPILSKVRDGENLTKNGMQYMELKKQLLLSYCQAITFYLLLKSEGQSVRDHPVIARLVEIKNLLDKVKELDENLPSEVDNILNKKHCTPTMGNISRDVTAMESIPFTNNHKPSAVSSETQKESPEVTELTKVDSSRDHDNKGKRKHQNDQLSLQSMEMLKLRAAFEEKLKQKGVSFTAPKRDGVKKNRRPVNGKLEARDDFDDDTLDIERNRQGMSNGLMNGMHSSRLSQLVTPQIKKPKVISGDDDLPKRDDIGERRRKHELRVLAGAGIQSDDDFRDDEPSTFDGDRVDDMNEDCESESDLEFYKESERKHAAKLAAKAEKYSRTPAIPSLPETLADGKRHINNQMEKNRGLTRNRNRLIKNPRVNLKRKHKKKVEARKGQVRDVRKPSGPYGGETSGINAGISRSRRFKN